MQDAEVADKKIEKGLLIVHTGAGKGKSTAAFGLALRMLGRGKRVGVVQFIKGAWHSAERDALEKFGDQVVVAHDGRRLHLGHAGPQARHRRGGTRLGEGARTDGGPDTLALIILDELNIALRYDYLNLQVGGRRRCRRDGPTCTSSSPDATPSPSLIAAADLVTDMSLVKHHFAAGVKAQPGIEF